MSNTKVALLAGVVAIGISSPVLAQSGDLGLNGYGLVNGRNVYDLVPQRSNAPAYNAPAFTGGGSIGYNANLLRPLVNVEAKIK